LAASAITPPTAATTASTVKHFCFQSADKLNVVNEATAKINSVTCNNVVQEDSLKVYI
jgi:hypothetical protein